MIDHRAEREWHPYDECPCRVGLAFPKDGPTGGVWVSCGVRAAKLTKYGHAVGCTCRSCIGRRNQRKGHKAQAKAHRALGGTGFTPHDEESARPYTIEVTVMPESKTGQQVPASWVKFITTDWFRRAMDQARRAVPTGSGALPAVVIHGDWCVIDLNWSGVRRG